MSCVLTLVAALVIYASAIFSAEVDWQPLDFPAAMRKAEAERKLIYILVEGDDCPPCDAFMTSHLADPAFIDFINTIYVPLRAHESDANGKEFLESLRLIHAAVPRFYALSHDGRGVSMSIGMVAAPPMGAAEVLKLALGRELRVDKERAADLAGRIRSHAASQRAAGNSYPDNPLRYLGLAILESQAWALAGRLDEAEKAFGAPWANQLADQEIHRWYISFWLSWHRNLPGTLEAARAFRRTSPDDPTGHLLMGVTLAANGRFAEAVKEGETYLSFDPGNSWMTEEVKKWKSGKR